MTFFIHNLSFSFSVNYTKYPDFVEITLSLAKYRDKSLPSQIKTKKTYPLDIFPSLYYWLHIRKLMEYASMTVHKMLIRN